MGSPSAKLILSLPLPSLVQTRSTVTATVVATCAKAVRGSIVKGSDIATNSTYDTARARRRQNEECNMLFLLLAEAKLIPGVCGATSSQRPDPGPADCLTASGLTSLVEGRS